MVRSNLDDLNRNRYFDLSTVKQYALPSTTKEPQNPSILLNLDGQASDSQKVVYHSKKPSLAPYDSYRGLNK